MNGAYPVQFLLDLQLCLFQLEPNSEKSRKYNLQAISNEVDSSKTKKLYLKPPKSRNHVQTEAGKQADWLTSDWLGEDLEVEGGDPLPARQGGN